MTVNNLLMFQRFQRNIEVQECDFSKEGFPAYAPNDDIHVRARRVIEKLFASCRYSEGVKVVKEAMACTFKELDLCETYEQREMMEKKIDDLSSMLSDVSEKYAREGKIEMAFHVAELIPFQGAKIESIKRIFECTKPK